MTILNEETLAAMTAEVIKSNDRLIGMLRLVGVGLHRLETHQDIFDERAHVRELLESAVGLTSSDGARARGVMSVDIGTPLRSDQSIVQRSWTSETGAELVVEFWRDAPYLTPDTMLFDGFVDLAASAVTQAQMHREALASQLAIQEGLSAAELILAALPDPESPPTVPGANLFASMTPASLAGGDFFFWQMIDGRLWFAVGDVSGKGLKAAVQMTTLATSVRNAIDQVSGDPGDSSIDPVAALRLVDKWMHDQLSNAAMFATLCIGSWDPETSELSIANAGHSPVVYTSRGSCERINATIPPIGVLAGLTAEPWKTVTQRGDLLALGSDGVTEQVNHDGAMFGEDRFDDEVLHRAAASSASVAGSEILAEVATHAEGAPQSDDRTLMVLQFERGAS